MFQKRLILFFCIIFTISCDNAEKGLSQRFPGPGFEKGWSWHGLPVKYNKETLSKYLNEEAELYKSNGFKECATLTYMWGKDTTFVVDIYDMGETKNALKIFSYYREANFEYKTTGTGVIISDSCIRFFQGRYLVNLKPGEKSDKTRNAVFTIAAKILHLLPDEGRVKKSLKYVARNMLNKTFLPEGLEARYRSGNYEVTGFVVIFPNDKEAVDGFTKLMAFYKENGRKLDRLSKFGEDAFTVKTNDHGYLVLQLSGAFIAGGRDFRNVKDGISFLRKIDNIYRTGTDL